MKRSKKQHHYCGTLLASLIATSLILLIICLVAAAKMRDYKYIILTLEARDMAVSRTEDGKIIELIGRPGETTLQMTRYRHFWDGYEE